MNYPGDGKGNKRKEGMRTTFNIIHVVYSCTEQTDNSPNIYGACEFS